MLCEPPMQSMCSLRHQCHSHGSLPHPAHHCPARASLPCLCARSAACRECLRRGDRNACSRARCAARAPLLYPRTTALLMRHKRGVSRIPSLSGSKCLLARQMRRPCAAALPAHHRPAYAPEARRVVNALAEGIKMPARAPDAGSCTHSHFHMRVRAAIPTPICGFAQPIPTHTCKPARAAFSTPGFPAIARPNSRFPGSPRFLFQVSRQK